MGLSDRDELVLGLLAAPGRPTEVAEALAEDLPGLLADRVTDAVSWRIPVRTDPAVADMGHGVEAIDLARARLLRDGWDLAVCITDAKIKCLEEKLGTRIDPGSPPPLYEFPLHAPTREAAEQRVEEKLDECDPDEHLRRSLNPAS